MAQTKHNAAGHAIVAIEVIRYAVPCALACACTDAPIKLPLDAARDAGDGNKRGVGVFVVVIDATRSSHSPLGVCTRTPCRFHLCAAVDDFNESRLNDVFVAVEVVVVVVIVQVFKSCGFAERQRACGAVEYVCTKRTTRKRTHTRARSRAREHRHTHTPHARHTRTPTRGYISTCLGGKHSIHDSHLVFSLSRHGRSASRFFPRLRCMWVLCV